MTRRLEGYFVCRLFTLPTMAEEEVAAVVADNGSDDAPRVELLETVFVVMKGREERREEREEKRGKRREEEATKERGEEEGTN